MRYTIVAEARRKSTTGEMGIRWTMRLWDLPKDIAELFNGKKLALGWSKEKTDGDRAKAEEVARARVLELCGKYHLPVPDGDVGVGQEIAFAELAAFYLGACESRGSDKDGTNASAIKNWMVPYFGQRAVMSLKSQDGDAWVKWMRERACKKGAPLKANTIDRNRRILRAILNYAVDNDYLEKNPFRNLKTPKGPKRKRVISVDELVALAPGMSRQLRAATLAGLMIMQRQEIIYDIYREHIVKYPSGYVVNLRAAHSDTKLSLDTMPLNRISLAALNWENPAPISGRIFHTWGEAHSLSKEFGKAVKRARIPHAVYHDLRHTAATALQTAKFNPMAIEKLLGHVLPGVLGDYQHGWDVEYREAVDILEKTYRPVAEAYGFSFAGLAGLSEVSQVSKQL